MLAPSTLLRLPAALYGAGPVLSAVPVFGSSATARIRLRLRVVSSPPQRFRQPKACARSPGRGAPFPSAVSSSRSQKCGRPLPRCGAPFPSAASGSGSQRFGQPLPRRGTPFPSAASGPGSQEVWAHLPRMWRSFSLRGPSAHHRSGLRKPLDRNRGPVCSVDGGGFSGAEFSPFPSPLPPSSSGDGPALLWSFSVPLFCEPPAVCSGRLIFFRSPSLKKSPSDCSPGL